MLLKWLALCIINCSIATSYSSSHITQVLLSKCSGNNRYTTTCFKLDFLRLMSLLGENTRLPLGPGVALVGTDKTRAVAEKLDNGLVSPRSRDQLDNFIVRVVEEYLGSLNLTVQLKDSAIIRGARGMVTDVFEALAVAGYATIKSVFSFLAVWYYEWFPTMYLRMERLSADAHFQRYTLETARVPLTNTTKSLSWNSRLLQRIACLSWFQIVHYIVSCDPLLVPLSMHFVRSNWFHEMGATLYINSRLKKTRWAFLWTILAILFAVMAGLSGSALMASMIALILSSVVVLRAALGGGAGFGAPPSGFGYALPVGHTTASGRITAYDLNPEVYMDDNSHSASSNTPIAYSAYARQSYHPMNGSKPLRPV